MPFKTLGEALYAKGFTRTGFYPPDAFEKDPMHPKVTYGEFNPNVPWVDGQLHGSTAGKLMDLRYGSGAFTAKGNPAGAYHGRESTWWVDDREIVEFLDLDSGFEINEGWSEEDLKYVCNKDGLFAYSWLWTTYSSLSRPDVDVPLPTTSTKTPLDQRAEEVRAMIRDIGNLLNSATGHVILAGLISDSCWPLVKPFVVALIAAHRKIMEG